jgi:hypothetical protein
MITILIADFSFIISSFLGLLVISSRLVSDKASLMHDLFVQILKFFRLCLVSHSMLDFRCLVVSQPKLKIVHILCHQAC